jgi:glyoxylase-like metal-dependent hydrolase (beta-lactamase superfamily II)
LIASASDVSGLLGQRVTFAETLGHTPGMLHARIAGERARLFFAADLVPGRAWVHLPITMGYDRYPEHLIDEKAALFADLASRGEYLFFTHDPEIAAATIHEAGGRYKPSHEIPAFRAWDLDAHGSPS